MAHLGNGDYPATIEVIGRDNPLPLVCGLVCPAPCESACVRGSSNGAVFIRPAWPLAPAERAGTATLVRRHGPAAPSLGVNDLALPGDRPARVATRSLETPPDEVRVRFIDETADYRVGGLTVRRDPADGGGVRVMDLPIVGTDALAGASDVGSGWMVWRAAAAGFCGCRVRGFVPQRGGGAASGCPVLRGGLCGVPARRRERPVRAIRRGRHDAR